MKTLNWVAAIVMFVGISWLLLFTLVGFGKNRKEITERTPPGSAPESVMNLPVQNIRELEDDDREGFQFRAELQEATLIDGFPCAAGQVRFTRSGQLISCTISEDAVIHNNLIPKDTYVELHKNPDRQVYLFPEDTEIQGYQIRSKTGRLGGSLALTAMFYPSGQIMSFASSSNAMIRGIPCGKTNLGIAYIPVFSGQLYRKYNMETAISLHENGNLRRCTLSTDAEIDGQHIPAGSDVRLSEDGKLMKLDDSWQRRFALWTTGIFD